MLLALGATLGSLNADVQKLVAHAPLGAGLAGHRSDRRGGRDRADRRAAGPVRTRRRAGLVVLLALAATVSTAANKSYRDQLAVREPALLANRVAGEMADFDRTALGDARRCALRAEFRTLYADSAFSLQRFDQSLDVAARQQAGVRFCEAAR